MEKSAQGLGIFSESRDGDDITFTARDFVRLLFKHKVIIFLVFVIVSAALAFALWELPPTFVTEGKILVNTEQQATPSFFSGIAAYKEERAADPANRKIETEMELVTTRELSERVVKKLGLTYDQVYHKPLTIFLRPVGEAYDWLKEKTMGQAPDPDKYGFKATVKEFNESFTVAPLKSRSADTTSNLFSVTLRSADPVVAESSLRALLDEYVRYSVEQNQRIGEEARKLIAGNVDRAHDDLIEREAQFRVFLAKAGGNLTRNAVQSAAPVERPGTPLPRANENEPTQSIATNLRNSLVNYQIQLMNLRQVFSDDAENVKVLRQTIADLEKRIQNEIRMNAQAEVTQVSLQRNVRTAELRYQDLQRKLDQIDLFLKVNASENDSRAITESPLLPKQSEWRKAIAVWILGSIGGLFLGLAFAGYREYSDHRLQSAEALERYLGIPVLTTINKMGARTITAVLRPDLQRSRE